MMYPSSIDFEGRKMTGSFCAGYVCLQAGRPSKGAAVYLSARRRPDLAKDRAR